MDKCNLCPRKCNTDRTALTGNGKGFCNMPANPIVAKAFLHQWEEPPISGTNGSGAIFFSGCNLKCVYCQNHAISRGQKGEEYTAAQLRDLYNELIEQGAHNINLVTGTHFADTICKSLAEKLPVPVVYNCGGYESTETLKLLENKVSVYLPDLKYSDNTLAQRLSKAPDYFEIATRAITEMYRQTGDYVITEDGLIEKGVIIRHLILPGYPDNTKGVIDWVANTFKPGQILFSLMSQFTSVTQCTDNNLNRKLTSEEYEEIADYLYESGIEDGFMQELSSASEDYIPDF